MSPRFSRMTAHVLMAAAIGRRSYVEWDNQALFLNLYCGMVAKPGSGKSQPVKLAKQVLERLNEFKDGTHIYLGNDSTSKASLVNDLMKTKIQTGIIPGQPVMTLHEMTCLYDELATFLPAYEADKVGLLLKLFDCPALYRETRVTVAEDRELQNVYFNWFFGTTPEFWARLLAFEQETGIKSRTILCSEDVDIHARELMGATASAVADGGNKINSGGFISQAAHNSVLALARDLAVVSTQQRGLLQFGVGYAERINQWWAGGGEPIPAWLGMGDYPVRRPMHVIKLSAHRCVSRGGRIISTADLDYAFAVLNDWEESTKHISADLKTSEHGRIMDDTYQFFYARTVTRDGKIAQFSGQDLRRFLSTRVRAVEIEVMVTQMIQAGYIKPMGLAVAGMERMDMQGSVKFQRFCVLPQVRKK